MAARGSVEMLAVAARRLRMMTILPAVVRLLAICAFIFSNYVCAAPDHDGEQDEETGDGLASKMFPFSQREQFAPEVSLRLSA